MMKFAAYLAIVLSLAQLAVLETDALDKRRSIEKYKKGSSDSDDGFSSEPPELDGLVEPLEDYLKRQEKIYYKRQETFVTNFKRMECKLSAARERLDYCQVRRQPVGPWRRTWLYLHTRKNEGKAFRVSRQTTAEQLVNGSGFNPKAATVVIVHGWLGRRSWTDKLAAQMLSSGAGEPPNVYVVDWGHYANSLNYLNSVNGMREVAHDMVDMFRVHETAFANFNMSNLHLIGHSLGAHVAGMFGQALGGKLERITALDATAVHIAYRPEMDKLTVDDAKFVSAYHTDSGCLGSTFNMADRDVFINGGYSQPGCSNACTALLPLPAVCRHERAPVMSILTEKNCIMVAYRCSSYLQFLGGKCGFCRDDECHAIGLEHQYGLSQGALMPTNVSDSKAMNTPWINKPDQGYYLSTNGQHPFCINTYQVIVQFAAEAELKKLFPIKLKLKTSSSTENGFLVTLNEENSSSGECMKVYAGSNGDSCIKTGQVYTSLVLIEPHHALYREGPVKFNAAILDKLVLDAVGQVNVFVNFMSHFEFSKRAEMSGPVSVSSGTGARHGHRESGRFSNEEEQEEEDEDGESKEEEEEVKDDDDDEAE